MKAESGKRGGGEEDSQRFLMPVSSFTQMVRMRVDVPWTYMMATLGFESIFERTTIPDSELVLPFAMLISSQIRPFSWSFGTSARSSSLAPIGAYPTPVCEFDDAK